MHNTPHCQHLKDKGVEWYLKVTEFDSLHDGTCQVGNRRSPGHSYIRARGSESHAKQLRFAELREKQEQGVVQVKEGHPDISQLGLQCPDTKSCDLSHDDATADGQVTLKL